MWFSKFYEIAKAPVRVVFSLMLFSSILLLSPELISDYLGFSEFKEQYHSTIGVLFVLSASVLLTDIFGHLFKYLWKLMKNMRSKKHLITQLNKLSQYEKGLISNIYKQDGHTMLLAFRDGKHARLENLGYIYRSTSMSGRGQYGQISFAYSLQPWLIDYVNENPQFLRNLPKKG